MGEAHSKNGKYKNDTELWSGNLKGTDHSEDMSKWKENIKINLENWVRV
jgi:hypothetical protein